MVKSSISQTINRNHENEDHGIAVFVKLNLLEIKISKLISEWKIQRIQFVKLEVNKQHLKLSKVDIS